MAIETIGDRCFYLSYNAPYSELKKLITQIIIITIKLILSAVTIDIKEYKQNLWKTIQPIK